MVQRSHAEDPLAVGELEISHLQDIGQGLRNVDDAHRDQDQGDIQGERQPAHRSPQKQRAGVPHKDLGRIKIIDQEGAQPSKQGGGKDAQFIPGPEASRRREEQRHRHGHPGGQTVDSVGDIHRVYRPHHHKRRKHHVQRPGDQKGHVEKGDVERIGQVAVVAHEHGKQYGRRQLEQELLGGGQAGVLMLFHLKVVVDIADDAEHQGPAEAALGKILPPQQKDRRGDADDEHQPSHGGGPLFGPVPGGPDVLDGLARLHPPQRRDQRFPRQGGHHKGHHKADDDPQHIFCTLQSTVRTLFSQWSIVPQHASRFHSK